MSILPKNVIFPQVSQTIIKKIQFGYCLTAFKVRTYLLLSCVLGCGCLEGQIEKRSCTQYGAVIQGRLSHSHHWCSHEDCSICHEPNASQSNYAQFQSSSFFPDEPSYCCHSIFFFFSFLVLSFLFFFFTFCLGSHMWAGGSTLDSQTELSWLRPGDKHHGRSGGTYSDWVISHFLSLRLILARPLAASLFLICAAEMWLSAEGSWYLTVLCSHLAPQQIRSN